MSMKQKYISALTIFHLSNWLWSKKEEFMSWLKLTVFQIKNMISYLVSMLHLSLNCILINFRY